MTGQYPRRRETDREAKRRVDALRRRRKKYLAEGVPLSPTVARLMRPWINASGRLVSS